MLRKCSASAGMLALLIALSTTNVDAQYTPNGWIQTDAWNMLFPLLNPYGATGGGQENMLTNWIAPHQIGLENPKAGTEWADIDFGNTATATGYDTAGLFGQPTWISNDYLEAAIEGDLEFPNGDVVDFQGYVDFVNANLIPAGNPTVPGDNVLGIATTYVENTTGGPLAINVCSASDDSIQVWINDGPVTNVSSPRGTAGDCAERLPAVLPAGISKISVLVFEGGGGWGFRLALELDGSKVVNDPRITFLGSGLGDDGIVGQALTVAARTTDPLRCCECPNSEVPVLIQSVVPPEIGSAPGDAITVVETITAGDPTAIHLVSISNGGVVEDITAPDDGIDPATGAVLEYFVLGPIANAGGADPGLDAIRAGYLAIADADVATLNEGNTVNDVDGVARTVRRIAVNNGDALDFNQIGGDGDNIMHYAWTKLTLADPTDVIIGVNADDGVQVLVDGAEVTIHSGGAGVGGVGSLEWSGLASLSAGTHTIVTKVFEGSGGHGVRLLLYRLPAGGIGAGGLDCASALPIAPGETGVGSTSDGNVGTECDPQISPAKYFVVTGTGARMRAETCNPVVLFDTYLAVFAGSCDAAGCLASNDDTCGRQSAVEWDSVAGETYYIRVYGWDDRKGVYFLRVSDTSTPAEAPLVATVLTGAGVCADPDGLCDTEAVTVTAKRITWNVTRAALDAGLTYKVNYEGSGFTTHVGEIAGQTSVTTINGSVISYGPFAPDTGPVGVFDGSADIGSVNNQGSTVLNPDGSYTVSGSGGDIWTSGDNFHFAYKLVEGDFDARARLVDIQAPNAGTWGRYGLMLRYSCNYRARHSFAMHTVGMPQNTQQPRHSFRPTNLGTDLDTSQVVDDRALVGYPGTGDPSIDRRPQWFRLVRQGTAVYSFMSFQDPDTGQPIQWCQIGVDVDPNRPARLLVGLGVGSHGGINNQELVHITFDNFTITQRTATEDATLVLPLAFGSRNLTRETASQPGTNYKMVHHSANSVVAHAAIAYDAGRGWGFEELYDAATSPYGSRNGSGAFGPFDDSPNSRGRFSSADTDPDRIYDSFIGFKNFLTDCSAATEGGPEGICYPPEGGVFRVDVPNGRYRFVGAFGESDNPHATRVVAEDGGGGPAGATGPNSVVLVENYDQAQYAIGQAKADCLGCGVFARVGFDDKLPPVGDGVGADPQFINMDQDGRPTMGPADSPILEVTQGYIRFHFLQGNSNNGPGGKSLNAETGIGSRDPNGPDIVLLEVWRLEEKPAEFCRASESLALLTYEDPADLGIVVQRGGGFTPAVVDGRLRLTEDNIASSANAVWYGIPSTGAESAPILSDGFVAEFDAFLFKADGATANPADGMTFTVISTGQADGLASAVGPWPPGLDVVSLGGDGGGSFGYVGGTLRQRTECHPSFAIEIDTWVGGGNNEVADGGSTGNPGRWHAGVDIGTYNDSVQNSAQAGAPSAELPDIFSAAGVHFEIFYKATGKIDVYATANDGSVGRRRILSTEIYPLALGDVIVGFTGGTGGATARQEVDNFVISSVCCEAEADSVTISGPADVNEGATATYTADVTGVDPGAAAVYQWSVIEGSAELGATNGATLDATFNAAGTVVLSVTAGDGNCEDAVATITVEVTAASCDLALECTVAEDKVSVDVAVTVAGTPFPDCSCSEIVIRRDGEIVYTGAASGVSNLALPEGCAPDTEVVFEAACVGEQGEGTPVQCSVVCPLLQAKFIRGDCNQDGEVCGSVSDLVRMLEILFFGTGETACPAACDANGNGDFSGDGLSDVMWIANYCFTGENGAPPAPYPDCGNDLESPLTCEGPTHCTP